MKQFHENYRKVVLLLLRCKVLLDTHSVQIRNTLRYLSSNLWDFSFREDRIRYSDLLEIDKYILHQLYGYIEEVSWIQ